MARLQLLLEVNEKMIDDFGLTGCLDWHEPVRPVAVKPAESKRANHDSGKLTVLTTLVRSGGVFYGVPGRLNAPLALTDSRRAG